MQTVVSEVTEKYQWMKQTILFSLHSDMTATSNTVTVHKSKLGPPLVSVKEKCGLFCLFLVIFYYYFFIYLLFCYLEYMNTCQSPHFLKFPLFFKVYPSFWDIVMCCRSNLWGALSLCIHRTRQQWGNYQEKINPFETLFKPLYYKTRLFQPSRRKKWEISMHLMCEL